MTDGFMATDRKMTSSAAQLGDLRAFCLAVDLGSITAAAKISGLTKGALSRRITRLERALGTMLVRRSPRLVQATEYGAAYKSQIQSALDLLDQASDSVDSQSEPRGHLRITTPPGTGIGVLAPLILKFSERYPEIQIEMILAEQPIDFDANRIDVAIHPARKLPDSSLIAHKLLDFELALVASPDYLARCGAPQKPSDLDRHRLLYRAGHQHIVLVPRRAGKKGGVPRDLTLRSPLVTTDNAFIREAALAGGGIALLSTNLCEADIAAGRLVRVLADQKVADSDGSLYLLYLAMRFVPPKIRVFRDFMLEHLSDRPSRRATARRR